MVRGREYGLWLLARWGRLVWWRGGTSTGSGLAWRCVELVVDAADELDAVDRAVAANHGVEDYFALDVLVY